MERCPSGLRCGPRKSVWAQVHRGFESHPLRHFSWYVAEPTVPVGKIEKVSSRSSKRPTLSAIFRGMCIKPDISILYG